MRLHIEYPANRPERVVNAARLDGRLAGQSAGSAYVRLSTSGDVVRVSDHARQSHHAAWRERDAADISVLLLTEHQAAQYARWREAAPRDVEPAEVIIYRPRQWAATLGRELRRVLAHRLARGHKEG